MRLVLRTLATTSAMALAGCSLFQQDQPHEARISLHLADTALAAGAPTLALRVADIVLENRPNDVAAMVAKADALYALGSVDAARDEYSKAVAIQPANVNAQIGLGRTLVKSDPHAAERAFQAALAHRPNSEPALNDLGIALDLQGRHVEAQKAYRQALTVSPDNSDVRTNLNLSVALADTGVNGAGIRPRIATIPQTAPQIVPQTAPSESVPIGPAAPAMARGSGTEPAEYENRTGDGDDQTHWTSAPRDHAASHVAPAAPLDVARRD
ncbi:MAG TPA: tetratricopeptide repeat protein, partial [Rhodopila sp.]